jgi:hypothetical protein
MIWLFFLIDKLYSEGTGLKPIGPTTDLIIVQMKDVNLYISFSKSFLYMISSLLTIFERRKMKREIKNSLLLVIDDNLTEEIYQNIIQQSKNPDNPELVEEYKRLISMKRITPNSSAVMNESINAIYQDRSSSNVN